MARDRLHETGRAFGARESHSVWQGSWAPGGIRGKMPGSGNAGVTGKALLCSTEWGNGLEGSDMGAFERVRSSWGIN